MARRPRDSQRSKVYEAEMIAFPKMKKGGMTLAEVTSMCEMIYEELMDRRDLTIKDGRGRRSAGACKGKTYMMLSFPTWARTREVVLHEIAHTITPKKFASHGPEFCKNYIDLVAKYIGKKEARHLHQTFQMNRVKVSNVDAPLSLRRFESSYEEQKEVAA